ncbi:acetyltransferase [Escherichia coli]|uniref:acetyltransferase n=1 Tax=Escherichia coli TaxID=562 RepID=UPI001BDB842F|nr:acetyltransferase [Escherichia coli]EHO0060318.1 acetyltransferase [Escherichia coli]EHR8527499.1 acetyltransferase [Escherichia coli]EHS9967595.1 acetyltransferase [Escherichia coli]EHZ4759497.1 acetyltransferase [Escherichia coli]EID8807140.1 acetyltransferase [Escherichia coli]
MPIVLKNFLRLTRQGSEVAKAFKNIFIDETEGEVVIGEGTRICHGAVIKGPVVIGSNCIVGNSVFIRQHTVIGNNVKIGFSAEVKNSVIESNVTIGPMCFVADSVLCERVYLGAQVRTSNHRLDDDYIYVRTENGSINTGCKKLGCYIGKKSKLGVQVIVLPGRQIKEDTIIGPRIIIERNLDKGKYFLKQEVIQDKGKC